MSRFHGVRLITCSFGPFKRGAAMALPGIGIVIGRDNMHDEDLLMHEYGHILQARRWGFFFFYFRVALSSLMSAWKRPRYHAHHWTEWTANWLSHQYFSKDNGWNFTHFPIHPDDSDERIKFPFPRFCRDRQTFFRKYLNSDGDVIV